MVAQTLKHLHYRSMRAQYAQTAQQGDALCTLGHSQSCTVSCPTLKVELRSVPIELSWTP